MASQNEYSYVAVKLLALIQSDVNNMVPQWARGMIPPDEASKLADQCAKVAVDSLDDYRAQEKPK